MSFSAVRWAWECECPSSTAKTVLLFLADSLNEGTGQCNPSIERIKAYTQAGLAAVRKAVADLAEAGIVSMERADGTYSFHLNFTFSKRIQAPNRRKQPDSAPVHTTTPPVESDRGVGLSDSMEGGLPESTEGGLPESTPPAPVASDLTALSHPIPEPRIEPRRGSPEPTPESLNLIPPASHTPRTRKTRARSVAVLSPEDAANFQEFYAAYPRHCSPVTARAAYAKALANGVTHQRIMEGLRRQKFSDEWDKRPYPATWLNAGGYDNEAPPETVRPPREGVTDSLRRRLHAWAEAQDEDDDLPPTITEPLALEHVA